MIAFWHNVVDKQNFEFLTILAVTILVTALGSVLPNLVAPTRPHNGIRLWSEALVSHQLTYIAFFITLFTTSMVNLNFLYRSLSSVVLLLSVVFLSIGMLNNRQHEEIAEKHAERNLDDAGKKEFVGKNLIFALVSLIATLLLIFGLQFGKAI
jgi:hypothetical protein